MPIATPLSNRTRDVTGGRRLGASTVRKAGFSDGATGRPAIVDAPVSCLTLILVELPIESHQLPRSLRHVTR